MNFVSLQEGRLKELFGCDIEGCEFPLPLKLTTTMHDLEISYHIEEKVEKKRALKQAAEEQAAALNAQMGGTAAMSDLLSEEKNVDEDLSMLSEDEIETRQNEKLKQQIEADDEFYPFPGRENVPTLDFGKTCPIFERQTMEICIRNHTAIPTEFSVNFESMFIPKTATDLITDYSQTLVSPTAIIIPSEEEEKDICRG